ncbi:MAG: AAA family ATPase [Chloroflexota bacterium]
MSIDLALKPEQLYTTCDLSDCGFDTTDDLETLEDFVGQERAVEALEFGADIMRQGYNIFVLGSPGTGRHTLARGIVTERASQEDTPSDWCYVNNFDQPYRPKALRLPAGKGRTFQQDMERLIDDLQTDLATALDSDEYNTRRQVLEAEFRERQQTLLNALREKAQGKELTLLRTPAGLAIAPVRDGNVVSGEDFQKLPEDEQKSIQAEVEVLQTELQEILQQVPRWERELRGQIRELRREVTSFVIADSMGDLRVTYANLPDLLTYLDAVQKDVSDNLSDFLVTKEDGSGEASGPVPSLASTNQNPSLMLRRYQVNVLVDCSESSGAPVRFESNPTYLNLIGRVEQMAQMGALITDFTLIKPGQLHQANGGYILIDARELLTQAYAWQGLKRALQYQEIRIESPTQMLNLTSTVTLEPEPIPLSVKVILLGDRNLYYMLAAADPDFRSLFKVQADFSDTFDRTAESQLLYARMIGTICRREGLCCLTQDAVERVIEYSARLVSDSAKLTTHIQSIVDLLEEADHWASKDGAQCITGAHIQGSLDAQVRRVDRINREMQEQVLRETILIDTDGEQVGQINGLAVLGLVGYAFGKASRITARVRMGKGEVLDIEREVAMGGPTHTKGVLILSSFLGARYAVDHPLSLAASLVFEQSYGGVDGDSASSTELYALLSAIAEIPIKQSLAVTGSVNQYGQVQAIGGVNEKIEGFFDLCNARGLTGEQGVLIPIANVKHLMLREDVVNAVTNGDFHIYGVTTIDEGIEILTSVPAGEADEDGIYPEDTVNRRVADRLADFAHKRAEFDRSNE